MRTFALVAVFVMVFCVETVFIAVQAAKMPKQDCYRNGTCSYPDACWDCPKPEPRGYIRTPIFYFDTETQSCELTAGNIDEERGTCNSFDNEHECKLYCGLDHEDYEQNETC
ncbi:uncharacterized protein LOC119165760 [Rhipicephalus microplus]|uniref:uncharacterized protein LOC119165760 n=1 Tax=Rhipicephalus microplus TaxID=6941 RepID=UPI003F6C7363